MLYASLIASYNAAEKPFANPCEDRPAKILPQFIRAGRDAPVFFRRFLSPLGERGFSARKQPSPGTRFPPPRNRRPSMKTQPETTPTLCPLPPRAFRATDGEHRAENEEAPPRLPGLPRAEAEPQPEKFSACVRNKETVRTNGRASAFIKWDVRKTPTWDVGQYSEE